MLCKICNVIQYDAALNKNKKIKKKILIEVTMDTPRAVMFTGKSFQNSQTFTQTNH